MGEMPMGGAGVMSFLGMWMVMMVPMMLPALVPVLWRSRLGATHAVVVSAGYYLVWAVVGVAAYPVAVVVMPHLDAGVVVVIAGACHRYQACATRGSRVYVSACTATMRHSGSPPF